ncbi:MAG: ABC transporter permease [Thermoplasmata archaeon]|nr:ABC transporter permease [Thermoplasmata archaeon]TFG71010.1 MAG: ABC transporter permease [Methanomassiliicoccus sp.]
MSFNFVLFRMVPEDPALLMMNREPTTPMSVYWRNVETMGLNDSLSEQFIKYVYMTFTGDWGMSYQYNTPVIDVMKGALGWTILLVGTSTFLTFIIGMALGKIAALRRGKSADLGITGFGLFFYGMPVFWFAIVLMVIFGGMLAILPVGGKMDSGMSPFPISLSNILNIMEHMALPVATMTIGGLAGVILIMRNSLIDVMTEDYIVTAYAKGLDERKVMKRHAAPNARLPIVTTIAMDTAFILGGAFQVEVVFSYRGIGYLSMDAIWKMDYPMLQFVFLIGGVAIVAANLIADIVLLKLDPRVKIT